MKLIVPDKFVYPAKRLLLPDYRYKEYKNLDHKFQRRIGAFIHLMRISGRKGNTIWKSGDFLLAATKA